MHHPAFGLLGMAFILFIAFLFSEDKKGIRLRTVVPCFLLQILVAWFVLYVPFGQSMLEAISGGVQGLQPEILPGRLAVVVELRAWRPGGHRLPHARHSEIRHGARPSDVRADGA